MKSSKQSLQSLYAPYSADPAGVFSMSQLSQCIGRCRSTPRSRPDPPPDSHDLDYPLPRRFGQFMLLLLGQCGRSLPN